MMNRLRHNLCAFVAIALLASPAFCSEILVIEGGTLIDGTGAAPLKNSVILIENGRIQAVGPTGSVIIPAGARRIKSTGKYIIPGLMDANVHLVMPTGVEYLARYEDNLESVIEEAAQVALKHGLTTVFDSWGPLEELQAVRDRINQKQTQGARIFTGGNILGFSGPLGEDFSGEQGKLATPAFVNRINERWELGTGTELIEFGPEELRAAVQRYIARGPDFVKFAMQPHMSFDLLTFSPEQIRAIVQEVHNAGLLVQTHFTSAAAFQMAVDLDVDFMQHCSITLPAALSLEVMRPVIDGEIGCAIQSVTERRLEFEIARGNALAGSHQKLGRHWGKSLKAAHENERRLIEAGAPVMLATDGYIWDPDWKASLPPEALEQASQQLGEGVFLWFEATKAMGMKPMAAIQAATSNIARFYRQSDLGTVEAGKRADFLILDRNPLDDIMHVREIHSVFKDGVEINRDHLPTTPLLTVPRDSSAGL